MEKFMQQIKELCKNYSVGDIWKARYMIHDWEYYHSLGYSAVDAYKLAVETE